MNLDIKTASCDQNSQNFVLKNIYKTNYSMSIQ